MDKNNSNNQQNNSQTTNLHELNNNKTRGIYLRDDHCDWGSSGMNEFTKEFSEKN